MNGTNIELTRRRVLGGMAMVGVASAAAGAGTYAAFSDTETSENNTVQAGTLELGSISTSTLSATGIAPGWNTDKDVTVQYDSNSTVDPATVDVSFSITENDSATTPSDSGLQVGLNAAKFAEKIRVDTAKVENTTQSNSYDIKADQSATQKTLADGNDTYVDLTQITATHTDLLTNVAPGDSITVNLDLTLHSNAGNDAQADGIDIDVGITANQP